MARTPDPTAATARTGRILYLSEIGSLLPYDSLREGNGRKLRSTPLPWLKFRTPADTTPAGQRYAMRRRALKASPEGFAILGIYDEVLATFGGDRIAPIRGYLVNHHLRPASSSQVAMEIGCFDVPLVERAKARLLEVGLLVWRPAPDFAAAIAADKTLAPVYDPPDEPTDEPPSEGDDDPADDGRKATRRRRSSPRAKVVGAGGSARAKTRRGRQVRAGCAQPVRAEEAQNAGDDVGQSPQVPQDESLALSGELSAGGRQVASQKGTYLRQETCDGKLETCDGKLETCDVPPDTPKPVPPAASAAPSPPSALGFGRPDTKDPASAAPRRPDALTADAPLDTAPPTGDAPPETAQPRGAGRGDAPQGDAQTSDPPTGDVPTRDVSTGEARPADTGTGRPEAADAHPAAPARRPPIAEPLEPTEADPKQDQHGHGMAAPAPDACPRAAGGMGWHAEAFAQQVLDALYPTHDDLVIQGRRCTPPQQAQEFRAREMGCFVRAFDRALALVDQVGAARLIERALKEAKATHRKRPAKTRGRLWMYWMREKTKALATGRAGPP